ncbi:MAG: glutathione S-transferase family protein [Kofleriaceae bacterium]
MITLYGFGQIFPEGRGETKDLWVQWVLEETGLPYRVHALDHTGGELDTPAFQKISPFRQAPVIDDDGFIVAESAAIALYLAEKSGTLIPKDFAGRTHVTQWTFAAVSTIGSTLMGIDIAGIFDPEKKAPELHTSIDQLAARWLGEVDRVLEGREWLAGTAFTVADLMMACELRQIRKTALLKPLPRLSAFYERCFSRPAWQRTLVSAAERLGMTVEQIK